MKIDEKEIREVAAKAAPRHDLYAGIHKALRALMADTLLAVGRMDVHDDLEFAQATQRVVEMLDVLRSHLGHENDFVHPAMEAREPGTSGRIAGEHVQHQAHIARLAHAVEALRARPADDRAAAALALYRALSAFVAENFEHMLVEETEHNAMLWARYTDEELAVIHHELVASIPPPEMMYTMRWMVPFLSPAERVGLLQDIRWNAPPPVFQAILDTVRPHLTAREWEKLAAALGI
jgi:iron-sulfur cluster repair protein YtfE (RIC family)